MAGQIGTRFMMWLANTYGPGKLVEWVRRQEGSRAYYASHFRHVYGRSLTADDIMGEPAAVPVDGPAPGDSLGDPPQTRLFY